MKAKKILALIELAGGTTPLAALCGVHAQTVENWKKSGVPLRYWAIIMKRFDLKESDLYSIYLDCAKFN